MVIAIPIYRSKIYEIDETIVIQENEIKELRVSFPLTLDFKHFEENTKSGTLIYKILNLFTIKKVNATVVNDTDVYLGGMPIGVSLGGDGLIISGFQEMISVDGVKVRVNDSDLKVGDLIQEINGKEVKTVNDIKEILKDNKGEYVELTVLRDNEIFKIKIKPFKDNINNEMRLGLYLREGIQGIGTLTYIRCDNKRFGALGHPISIQTSSKANGNIYQCNIFGTVKGVKGKPGELRGSFNKNQVIGNIEYNNNYGIFGAYDSKQLKNMEKIKTGTQFSIHSGKALIYTTIDGSAPKFYDIEIIKTSYQSSAKEKGIVIKITDNELIEKTGGIVQGMSGSPIVQDGKLVGAVSHVFINDPTRGYGMYIDWMINN
jgi:stage IV sporulation protein B